MMKKYLILISVCLGLHWAKAQETINIDIAEQYRKGVELMNANQYEQALDYIYECQRAEYTNLDYSNRLGYCYFQLGNYREAKYTFQATLQIDSLNIAALSNLASISRQELNYREAQKYYGQLIGIDSTNSYYFKQQAQIMLKQGDYLAATALYNRAHQLNEKDLATIGDLASAYLELKALEYAQTVIDKGMALDSTNLRIRYTYARIRNAMEDYPAVVRAVQGAMAQGDSTAYYQMMLGVAYLKQDSLQQAIAPFTRLITWEKDSEHTHHYLALTYQLLGEIDLSIVHFNTAIEKGISGKVPRYHQDLAELYEQQKDFRKAYEHYKAANAYRPKAVLLFHIAHTADQYFKDKKIALRFYKKYLETADKKFQQYASQRAEVLKEVIHFGG